MNYLPYKMSSFDDLILTCLIFVLSELPGPPTNLAISNIGPRSVNLQFKPGYDGKTSISRWQVEAQVRRFISICT